MTVHYTTHVHKPHPSFSKSYLHVSPPTSPLAPRSQPPLSQLLSEIPSPSNIDQWHWRCTDRVLAQCTCKIVTHSSAARCTCDSREISGLAWKLGRYSRLRGMQRTSPCPVCGGGGGGGGGRSRCGGGPCYCAGQWHIAELLITSGGTELRRITQWWTASSPAGRWTIFGYEAIARKLHMPLGFHQKYKLSYWCAHPNAGNPRVGRGLN